MVMDKRENMIILPASCMILS